MAKAKKKESKKSATKKSARRRGAGDRVGCGFTLPKSKRTFLTVQAKKAGINRSMLLEGLVSQAQKSKTILQNAVK